MYQKTMKTLTATDYANNVRYVSGITLISGAEYQPVPAAIVIKSQKIVDKKEQMDFDTTLVIAPENIYYVRSTPSGLISTSITEAVNNINASNVKKAMDDLVNELCNHLVYNKIDSDTARLPIKKRVFLEYNLRYILVDSILGGMCDGDFNYLWNAFLPLVRDVEEDQRFGFKFSCNFANFVETTVNKAIDDSVINAVAHQVSILDIYDCNELPL